MATQTAISQKLLVGGYDIAQVKNMGFAPFSRAELDDATFGKATATKTKGLEQSAFLASGFRDHADAGHDYLFDTTDAEAIVGASLMAQAAAAGEVGHFADVHSMASALSLAHGELTGFSWTGGTAGKMVRGKVALAAATATATSSSFQLGGVTAGNAVYAIVHVIAASGATVDVVIRSDSDSGMAGATNRITIPQLTAIGSSGLTKFNTVETDDWWDADLTISGTATVYVLIGLARDSKIQ